MRYPDEARYGDGGDYVLTRPGLTPAEISQVTNALAANQVAQVTPVQVTANQNDYSLPDGELVRLSTDASRTFTGFVGARPGRFVLCNVGGFDVVIAHDSGSSSAENRVLCHTSPSNVTLTPNRSVEIIYDFQSSRWRTIGIS